MKERMQIILCMDLDRERAAANDKNQLLFEITKNVYWIYIVRFFWKSEYEAKG